MISYCVSCNHPIEESSNPVQCPVYKLGELDYIELAHRNCIPEWSVHDDWTGEDDWTTAADETYWENERYLEWCAQQVLEEEPVEEDPVEEEPDPEPRQARSCVPSGHLSELKYGSDHYNRRAYARAERHAGKAWTRDILKEIRAG